MANPLVPSDSNDFRQNHFNTLRLAMALLVVWSHSFALYFGSEDREPVSLLLNGQLNSGNIAVRVFFVVSGLLIARSFEASTSLLSYFSKRVRRIYPGYLVAVAICTFIVVPQFSSTTLSTTPIPLVEWLSRNLALRNYIPNSNVFTGNPVHAVNGALWSIPYEFWCYIGLAALGTCGALRRTWLIIAILGAVMLIKTGLDLTGRKPGLGVIGEIVGWPYLWTAIAPCFLAGVVLHKCGTAIPRSPLVLLGLTTSTVFAAHAFGPSRLLFDLILIPTLGYSVMYAAFTTAHIPNAARYGDFSYGAYLYGFPIQQMIKASLEMPFPAYVAACLGLSLCAGVASWFIIERRFLQPSSISPRESSPRQA
jgi:peptidoglycan/LPS O-acetylase OafA/YrhL